MAQSLDWRARRLVARIQKNHGDRDAIEALAAYYAKHADQASLANLMVGYAETLDDSNAAADAYVRAADAALMLDDRARAEALYERALQRDPGHSGALDRALRVAEAGSDLEGMRRVLSGAIAAARARALPRRQIAALQFRLGQLHETRLRDPERAAALYRQALESYPSFISAIAAARRLYRQAADWATVSQLYEAEIEASKALDDKRALLLRLAEHEQSQRGDLHATVSALRRACRLDPSHVQSLRKLAEALIARSERSSGRARETDAKRAAEVFYQIGRVVPRAEAAPLLLRALALIPQHARAAALLHELRGHAADGGDGKSFIQADQPQFYVDQRATVQVASPLLAAQSGRAAAPSHAPPPSDALRVDGPSAPERTQALDTRELRALRVEAPSAPAAQADQTQALSTQQLQAMRVDEVQPLHPDRTQALSTQQLQAMRVDEVQPPHPDRTQALSTQQLQAMRVDEVQPLHPDRTQALQTQELRALRIEEPHTSRPPPIPAPRSSASAAPPPIPAPPAESCVPAPALAQPAIEQLASEPPGSVADKSGVAAPALTHSAVGDDSCAPLTEVESVQSGVAAPAPLAIDDSGPLESGTGDVSVSASVALPSAPAADQAAGMGESDAALAVPVQERMSRARIVEQLELDPIRQEIEVNLGATTDCNLYVDMDGRVADGGVFVATYQSLSAGTPVTLTITLPGELQTRAHGRVTLKREHMEVFDDPIPGFCVAFETLSNEALGLLERFAAKRIPWLIEDD